ncbi:MAG: histidine phosphatase family protein [Phycisphaeraceae bacterium]|nr:histidine phosphatase family protein [Phycisphaeraceae bacterium]
MSVSATTAMLLIRHATSNPRSDLPEPQWPLSTIGRRQAEELSAGLESIEITQVISSPFLRAIDTVGPLARRIGREVDVREDLRERKLCEGIRPDWRKLLERAWADFSFALPGCESSGACQERVRRCLAGLANEFQGQTIAVCSHGNAIGLFLHSLDPAFGFSDWEQIGTPDVFWIDWCAGHPAKREWRLIRA